MCQSQLSQDLCLAADGGRIAFLFGFRYSCPCFGTVLLVALKARPQNIMNLLRADHSRALGRGKTFRVELCNDRFEGQYPADSGGLGGLVGRRCDGTFERCYQLILRSAGSFCEPKQHWGAIDSVVDRPSRPFRRLIMRQPPYPMVFLISIGRASAAWAHAKNVLKFRGQWCV